MNGLLSLADNYPTRDEVQSETVDAVIADRMSGRKSVVVSAPTSYGKTVISSKVMTRGVNEWGGKFLFLVDDKELVGQSEAKLTNWGLRVGVEQAERTSDDAMALFGGVDVIVASVDSLHAKRLDRLGWHRGTFTDIFHDECHSGFKGKMIRGIRDRFPDSFFIGLSATAYDSKGKSLVPTYFQKVSKHVSIVDAIRWGHISRPLWAPLKQEIDLSELSLVTGAAGRDYSIADLQFVIGPRVDYMVNAVRERIEEAGIKKLIHFAASVPLACEFAKAYEKVGFTSAALYSKLKDPGAVVRDYKDGRIQILCVYGMCIKGFDDPPTDGLVMARPTTVASLAWQMLGRGLRLSPDTGKDGCHVIGFNWKSRKNQAPVSTLDLFYSVMDPRDLDATKRLMARGKADIFAAMEEAREQREEKERLIEEAKKSAGLKLKVSRQDVNAEWLDIDPLGLDGHEIHAADPLIFSDSKRATKAQVQQMAALGKKGSTMTEMAAGHFIREWEGRRIAGMSSYKQCLSLKYNLGMTLAEAKNLTIYEAGLRIDAHHRRRSG